MPNILGKHPPYTMTQEDLDKAVDSIPSENLDDELYIGETREVAGQYHPGMWSAFYEFSSSGTTTDAHELDRYARQTILEVINGKHNDDPLDLEYLRAISKWAKGVMEQVEARYGVEE